MKLTQEQYDALIAQRDRLEASSHELLDLERVKPISSNNPDGDYPDGITLHLRELTLCTKIQINIILQNCEIIDLNESDTIQIGSELILAISSNGNQTSKKVKIVESLVPGMVLSDNLSVKSPLGKALLGKHEGEIFTFTQPNNQEVEVTICEIVKYKKER